LDYMQVACGADGNEIAGRGIAPVVVAFGHDLNEQKQRQERDAGGTGQ
jgi:hypothetical protein